MRGATLWTLVLYYREGKRVYHELSTAEVTRKLADVLPLVPEIEEVKLLKTQEGSRQA